MSGLPGAILAENNISNRQALTIRQWHLVVHAGIIFFHPDRLKAVSKDRHTFTRWK
jgi:hypothetical protein